MVRKELRSSKTQANQKLFSTQTMMTSTPTFPCSKSQYHVAGALCKLLHWFTTMSMHSPEVRLLKRNLALKLFFIHGPTQSQHGLESRYIVMNGIMAICTSKKVQVEVSKEYAHNAYFFLTLYSALGLSRCHKNGWELELFSGTLNQLLITLCTSPFEGSSGVHLFAHW